MKILFTGLFCLLYLNTIAQSDLQGAWQLTEENGISVNSRKMTVIFSEDYFMFGNHHQNGRFISAGGGIYTTNGDKITLTFDFFTDESSIVRTPLAFDLDVSGNSFELNGNVQGQRIDQSWSRVEEEPDALNGAWRFATRVDENGQPGKRRKLGPRQTIKILGGGHFQWAAFNYETKEFMGTGGGSYTAENGKYVENIEFFSRDDNRVGAALGFEFQRKDNDWYHKGKSSKGDPLHEVWTKLDR